MLRVIILNHSRPKNVMLQANVLSKYFPVTIINNNPKEQLRYFDLEKTNIEVINNSINYYCMERWVRCYEYPEPYKLILDDDFLPSISLIKEMVKANLPITGIYGRRGVDFVKRYEDLEHCWASTEVDFLVGSCILVKQSLLNSISKLILNIGYPRRGDDIIISYAAKTQIDKLFVTTGPFRELPEGEVGLNKDSNHYIERWKVVEKFKNIDWTEMVKIKYDKENNEWLS